MLKIFQESVCGSEEKLVDLVTRLKALQDKKNVRPHGKGPKAAEEQAQEECTKSATPFPYAAPNAHWCKGKVVIHECRVHPWREELTFEGVPVHLNRPAEEDEKGKGEEPCNSPGTPEHTGGKPGGGKRATKRCHFFLLHNQVRQGHGRYSL